MADTLYDVISGFYDAVNYDRLYTADQMNMPYKRIVSNGVFATPNGTPSADFQVLAQSGMYVKVSAGNAILGDKWVELDADLQITVAANPTINARIDSIILRVDKNTSERKSSVIYRTGTAGATPTAPSLSTESNVYEFRLANITVGAGVTQITQANISDRRGSAECPWITSLIYQVDTSTLFNQYRAAYQAELDKYKNQWNEFFAQLTQDLTVSSNVIAQLGTYETTTAEEEFISFDSLGIDDFDQDTDTLIIYINGLFAQKDVMWEFQTVGAQDGISLLNPMAGSGQMIFALALKSIITGNMSTVSSLVGSPLVAQTAEDMTNINKVYVYTGSESGYIFGNWYYYNGTAWVSGGVYNAIAVNPIPAETIEAILEEE